MGRDALIILKQVKRTYPPLLQDMSIHYSQPKGFVGRNICYAIYVNDLYYGAIVGGSSTRHLAGRDEFFNWGKGEKKLNNIVNNIFYHVEKQDGKYPMRWFTVEILKQYKMKIEKDWLDKYGDEVIGHESLVELPRTGLCYKKAGWREVGMTKGFTCKRIAGKGTDAWSGKRVWDTNKLRPKRVFTTWAETH